MLILAPRGRDAAVIEQVLAGHGLAGSASADIEALAAGFGDDIGGLIVTEEALAGVGVGALLARIEQQPAWSDMPVMVLSAKQIGRRSAIASELLERLGNVMILERPVNAETMVRGVTSALRARRRQYQARAYLAEREQRGQWLRSLNETLEERVRERARELGAARETLAFALDAAGMGSWDMDLATGAARRSKRHDQIFGYSDLQQVWNREVFLGHVVEDDRADAAAAFERARTSGVFDLECKINRADGQQRWISAKGQIAHARDGTPARMAGVVMDISERRFAEEALRQSQKMQAIGQLTGGLAHDFNNLLTGITGSLELMQTRVAQGRVGEIERYVSAAQGAARKAAALTHRLLAFSRRQTLDPKPTNMNRLIGEMEELIQRTVGPMIRLATRFTAGLWPTFCDPNQLENALLNFCINARDAMPDGGRLLIATENAVLDPAEAHDRDMAAGQYVVLAVTDSGTGMSADVMARAFDPFFTTKPIGAGTGLGLSMAYGFARQSSGQLRIDSVVGRGSTIRLYLPRHSEEEATEAGDVASAVLPAQQGETVLVVDDEPTVRMLVREVLEELGYAALEAADSTGALAIVQSSARIDLLVTDVGLPGLNGRQLADAARCVRPALKILFITGYAEHAAVGHGHLDQGMHVLTKPFAIDVLARRIRAIL